MVDKIKPLKLEDPSDGGDETDQFPTSLDPNEDYLDCRGVVIQDNDSSDESVIVSRDTDGNLTLKDGIAGSWKLNELSGGALSESTHKTLRQLIHFIDEGPAEGFTSEAYREVAGTAFPTAVIWWESSSKLKKIVEQSITWTGPVPTTVTWKVYNTDGNLVATVSDAISYSGPFETTRTRTITVA